MHKPRFNNIRTICFRTIRIPVLPVITVAEYPRMLKLYLKQFRLTPYDSQLFNMIAGEYGVFE